MIRIDLQGKFINPYQLFLTYAKAISDDFYNSVKQEVFASFGALETVNDWVSIESLGNLTAIKAKKVAQMFAFNREKNATLDINLGDKPLNNDTFYALIFLSQQHNTLEVTLNYYKDNAIHNQLEILRAQTKLVLHLCETSPDESFSNTTASTLVPEFGLNLLDNSSNIPQALIEKIINYAFICLKLGAFELASTTLEDILTHTKQANIQEYALLKLQMCRLHSHQFKAAALQAYPEKLVFLDSNAAYFLLYIKAYCATMSRQLDIAKHYFQKLHIHEDMPANTEQHLYQLNIFALFNVLSGNKKAAMKLEQRIEQGIALGIEAPASLKYVNCINTARLHKMNKDYDKAKRYYQNAYKEISGGGYTNSDFIYYNINLASLWESAENYEAAYHYWLKASVHWLVLENPHALAWRAKLVLTQDNNDSINAPLDIARVSAFLQKKLTDMAQKTQRTLNKPNTTLQLFLNQASSVKEHCVVTPTAVFFASKKAHDTKLYHQDSHLLNTVSVLLQQDINLGEYNTLYVDTYCSEYLPTKQAAIALAKLNHCETCVYLSENIALNPQSHLGDFCHISPLINNIKIGQNNIKLQFERTFMNQQLHCSKEIALFKYWQTAKTANSDVENSEQDLAIVNQLLSKKVLSFNPRGREA